MPRLFTTSQVNAMPARAVELYLNRGLGRITDDQPTWIPGLDLIHYWLDMWINGDPWPVWEGVYCRFTDNASDLDSGYQQTGQTRNTQLSLLEAARWLLDWILENEWEPAES